MHDSSNLELVLLCPLDLTGRIAVLEENPYVSSRGVAGHAMERLTDAIQIIPAARNPPLHEARI